jgi:hypothetical protein
MTYDHERFHKGIGFGKCIQPAKFGKVCVIDCAPVKLHNSPIIITI